MSLSCAFASDNSNATIAEANDNVNVHVDEVAVPSTSDVNAQVDNVTAPGTYDDLKMIFKRSILEKVMTLQGITSLTAKAKQ